MNPPSATDSAAAWVMPNEPLPCPLLALPRRLRRVTVELPDPFAPHARTWRFVITDTHALQRICSAYGFDMQRLHERWVRRDARAVCIPYTRWKIYMESSSADDLTTHRVHQHQCYCSPFEVEPCGSVVAAVTTRGRGLNSAAAATATTVLERPFQADADADDRSGLPSSTSTTATDVNHGGGGPSGNWGIQMWHTMRGMVPPGHRTWLLHTEHVESRFALSRLLGGWAMVDAAALQRYMYLSSTSAPAQQLQLWHALVRESAAFTAVVSPGLSRRGPTLVEEPADVAMRARAHAERRLPPPRVVPAQAPPAPASPHVASLAPDPGASMTTRAPSGSRNRSATATAGRRMTPTAATAAAAATASADGTVRGAPLPTLALPSALQHPHTPFDDDRVVGDHTRSTAARPTSSCRQHHAPRHVPVPAAHPSPSRSDAATEAAAPRPAGFTSYHELSSSTHSSRADQRPCSRDRHDGTFDSTTPTHPPQGVWMWVVQAPPRPGCEERAQILRAQCRAYHERWAAAMPSAAGHGPGARNNTRCKTTRQASASRSGVGAVPRPTTADRTVQSQHDTTESAEEESGDSTFADDADDSGSPRAAPGVVSAGGTRRRGRRRSASEPAVKNVPASSSVEDLRAWRDELASLIDNDGAYRVLGAVRVNPSDDECVRMVAERMRTRVPDATDEERTGMARAHLCRLVLRGQQYLFRTPLLATQCPGVAPGSFSGMPAPSPFECPVADDVVHDSLGLHPPSWWIAPAPPATEATLSPAVAADLASQRYAQRLSSWVHDTCLEHMIPKARLDGGGANSVAAPVVSVPDPSGSEAVVGGDRGGTAQTDPVLVFLRAVRRAADWLHFWSQNNYEVTLEWYPAVVVKAPDGGNVSDGDEEEPAADMSGARVQSPVSTWSLSDDDDDEDDD